MADVLVIPTHRRRFARNRRQVRRRQANRLNAGLFVNTDRIDWVRAPIMNGAFGVESNIAVDHQHLMHLAVEVRISLLQVVGDLVGLELVLIENPPDRALAGSGKTRESRRPRLFGHIARQCRDAPQLRSQPKVLWFGARYADHPSLGVLSDFGGVGPVVGILQPRLNACRKGLVDALVDHRPADVRIPAKMTGVSG
jgi:hypothetical protein